MRADHRCDARVLVKGHDVKTSVHCRTASGTDRDATVVDEPTLCFTDDGRSRAFRFSNGATWTNTYEVLRIAVDEDKSLRREIVGV